MSSGGMDWAYRMIGQHDLDPLGVAVVLHLGWRDAANQRTDRGIALALGQHRSSVRLATAKLEAMGLICRRSGQWVAVETVKIVSEAADARRPDAASADDEAGPVSGHGPVSGPGQSVARPGPVSGPRKGQSVAPKRKEKIEKDARTVPSRVGARSASSRVETARAPAAHREGQAGVSPDVAAQAAALCPDPAALTAFQRARLASGQSVQIGGEVVPGGSALMAALCAAVAVAPVAVPRRAGEGMSHVGR